MSNTAQNNKYHTRLNIYGFWRKDYIYLKQDWEFNYSKFIINSFFEVDGQKPIDEKQHERVVHLTLTRFKSIPEMLNEIQHTVESLTTSLKQNCFSIDNDDDTILPPNCVDYHEWEREYHESIDD